MKKEILCLAVFSLLFISSLSAQSRFLGNDSLLVIQEGTASFYGKGFHKRVTASGEIFDMDDFTAAHKHLPFGTLLKVTNQKNGFEVIVKVNDRLPKNSRRIIDLSRTAAEQLDMIRDGLTSVQLIALSVKEIEKIKGHYTIIPDGLRFRVYQEPIEGVNDLGVFSPLAFQKEVSIDLLSTL